MIEAPTPVRAGDPVPMIVWTVGGGCVSLDSTEIVATEEGGDFTPYDRDTGSSGCPANLAVLYHEGLFTFDTPGRKTIRVHGRRQVRNGIDTSRYEPIEIPVTITVE